MPLFFQFFLRVSVRRLLGASENGFVVVKTPLILSLTPKTPHPSPTNFGKIFEESEGFTIVFLTLKWPKTARFSIKNLQILKTLSFFFFFFFGGGGFPTN